MNCCCCTYMNIEYIKNTMTRIYFFPADNIFKRDIRLYFVCLFFFFIYIIMWCVNYKFVCVNKYNSFLGLRDIFTSTSIHVVLAQYDKKLKTIPKILHTYKQKKTSCYTRNTCIIYLAHKLYSSIINSWEK